MSDIVGNNEPLLKVVCNECKHYNRDDFDHFSCAAFKSIPKIILMGAKHDMPLEGQSNNLVFEPTKE
jgi:hypothetical protein